MALSAWPISTYAPQQDSFSPIQRALDPITTEFEGGNSRDRPRPGDNVGKLGQTIWISMAEHDVVVPWVKTTLNLGTARFTMPVWLGSSFVTKTVKFIKPGSQVTYDYISADVVAMGMALWVFDI